MKWTREEALRRWGEVKDHDVWDEIWSRGEALAEYLRGFQTYPIPTSGVQIEAADEAKINVGRNQFLVAFDAEAANLVGRTAAALLRDRLVTRLQFTPRVPRVPPVGYPAFQGDPPKKASE